MKYLLGKTSTMFVVSGVVKIAAGIFLCLWPINDFRPLVYLFGIPSIIQGSVHFISATQYRNKYESWWVLCLLGIIYLAGGVVLIGYADITPVFLMIAIAATWSLTGIIMVLMSIQLNKESQSEFGLLLSGILSIMAGVYLLTNHNRDVYTVLWILVIYGFLIGGLMILFGVKARAWEFVNFDDFIE